MRQEPCAEFDSRRLMKLFLPARGGAARGFVFDRSRRDFTERDRLVLDLLRPHITSLCDAAQNRRVLAALETSEHSPRCLVVLGRKSASSSVPAPCASISSISTESSASQAARWRSLGSVGPSRGEHATVR
jgi:hypothetical protein